MKLVAFVSMVAAVAAVSRLNGAFPALPDQIVAISNVTSAYSTLEVFHNIVGKTCNASVLYLNGTESSSIYLSSLITAFSTSPAASNQYSFPLNNQTRATVAVSCNGGASKWVTLTDNNNTENWVAFASSDSNIQFTQFQASSKGFFPTYFSEQANVTQVTLKGENITIHLSNSTVAPETVTTFSEISFIFADGSNRTSKIEQTFTEGQRVVFWLTVNNTIAIITLENQGQTRGRFTILNGVTSTATLTIGGTTVNSKGDQSQFEASVAYGDSKVISFNQGDILKDIVWWFSDGKKAAVDVSKLQASLPWGTGVVLAGFNATLVAAGKSENETQQVVFIEDMDEMRAAIEGSVKAIVRFANALVTRTVIEYSYNDSMKANHAVRRILRPQDIQTFNLDQGQSQAVDISNNATAFEVTWKDTQKPEVNGTIDVLQQANARPEARAFNIFTIGDPANAAYPPKQVTTYDAAAPTPSPAPAEESNFWSQPWPYIVIAAFVLVVFGGGFYFYKKHQDNAGTEGKPLLG